MLNLRFTQWNNAAAALQIKKTTIDEKPRSLAQARAGRQVTITGYDQLSPIHRQHLQAYGLLPGRTILVLAQRPVTIVLVEQTELAFETAIARCVLVE